MTVNPFKKSRIIVFIGLQYIAKTKVVNWSFVGKTLQDKVESKSSVSVSILSKVDILYTRSIVSDR